MADQNGKTDRMEKIPVSKIRENDVALRNVDRENQEYLELAASVKRDGVLQPILVREFRNPANQEEILFGLIDGLQRFTASCDAGFSTIPAHIVSMDQAEIEEKQIIMNAQRVQTKIFQFGKQIQRLFQRNPTLTVAELCARLSKSPGWMFKVLGMVKKTHPDVQPMADDGRITMSSAYEISKLPMEEQLMWTDRAMTMEPGQFAASVAERVKEISETRRKGLAESPPVFKPVAHARTWKEIRDEFEHHGLRDSIIARQNISTPADAWDLAIAWAAHMDPDAQAEQIAVHNERVAEAERKKAARDLERTKQKKAEADAKQKELEQKISERAPAAVAG